MSVILERCYFRAERGVSSFFLFFVEWDLGNIFKDFNIFLFLFFFFEENEDLGFLDVQEEIKINEK